MNHKTLLGLSALVLSCEIFIHSLHSAHAFPQGPNVSMGSNPIDSHYQGNCNNSNLFTNSSQQDFIITDIVNDYSGWLILSKNSGGVTSAIFKIQGNGTAYMKSGIRISPGDTVLCQHYSGQGAFISGYYTHP